MRKSKKAAKGGKPEPEEAIMKEPTKHAEEQTIDPMDFLEAPAAKVDASAQADDMEPPCAICAGTSAAIGAPLLMRQVFRVEPSGFTVTIDFEEIRKGDRFKLLDAAEVTNPIEKGDVIYTATADAVTCEPNGNWMVTVADYPGEPIAVGQPSAADLDAVAEEQAIADMTTGSVVDSPEIKQGAVPQVLEPAKPIPPALPRRTGCEHGFPNVALCVTCRASGRR